MAEYEGDDGDGDEDELPSVDHGPLNEGPWEKHIDGNEKSKHEA